MSTKEASTDWTKLTVAQLKGALARRGLSSDGGKEELVKRLKEADDAEDFQNMAVDGEEETEEKPPMLFTADFKHYVGFMMSLKTVIINPFKLDMMQDPSFVAWLDDCLSYSIRKNGAGVSAVQLFFDSIEKGDAALADLKANLKDEELDIYHPRKFMKSKHAAIQIPEDFEELVDDRSADNLWRRLLLLENLPAKLNTEEKLSEFFPEAMQAISFNFVPASQGIAVLEFSTTKEAYDYKNSVGDEIKLEDQDIKVSKYLDRSHEWASANNLWMKAHKDKTPDLGSDEERLALINDLDQVTTEMEKFHQSDECFGQDKMAKFAQFEQKIKELRRRLHKDTKQRVSKGDLEMPEGENSLPFLHFLDEKKKPSEQTPEQNWEKLFQTDSKIHAVETELKSLNFAMSKLQEQLTKEQKEEWVEIQKQSINPKNKKVQGQYNRGKRGGFSGRGRGNTQQGRGGMQQARGGGNQGKGEGNKGRGGLQQGRGGGNRGRGGGNRGRGGGNQGRGGFQQGGQKKNQKRPGSMQSSYDMDEPPSKKQQINYGFRKNKNYKGGMQDYQGGNQNEGGQGNMALIEGITSALTDKMLQLENLQKQTLKTQAALLDNKPTSYSSGGGNKSYRGGYRGGSKSYSKGNRYGSSSRGGYSNSTGSGTNYGSSSRGGFSNSSGYGDSYGSSSRGGYSNTSGNDDIYGSSSRGGYSNSSGNGDSYGSSSRGGYSNTSGNGDSYGSSSRDGYSNSTYQY